MWQITAKLLSEGSSSVLSNSTLITRIYFPRVYFPGAVALTSLVDLFFNVGALLLLMLWYNYLPLPSVVAVPVLLVIAYAFSFGLSLWFAALHVFYRDVGVLVPFLTQVGFFLSPLIYPVSVIPVEYQALYYLNPMAVAIEGFRWALLGSTAPPLEGWVIGSVVAIVTLISGYIHFRQREGLFADVI